MRQPLNFIQKISFCLLVTSMLSGCDALVDGSNAAASVTGKAYSDAADTWSDVFTYHGKAKPNLPQTRYCYKMMSDIVCYDSVQPTLSAQLVGYQDGNHQSWIQPGGGSLGASGGAPVAYQQQDTSNSAGQSTVIAVRTPIEAQAYSTPNTNGEIRSLDLPAK